MAAKLLHSLADDNPDLQKQIGCMTGIFQLFDRNHVLAGRRLKRLPPGDLYFINGSTERESFNAYRRHESPETNLSKSLNEKHRLSTESSRASFSSSCSSSLSSLECNKAAHAEAPSFDRIIFPDTPSRDPVVTQPSSSPRLGWQSLDLRDVVKDSMYREARGLSPKTTTKEEVMTHVIKHKDSPRPLHQHKLADGSYGLRNKGKQNVPADLKESLRVLSKLREAPWYYSETREHSRSSYEAKEGSWHTISKDAPRFSYEGRENSRRLSFESRDTIKCTPKLKELPRLSLDSREISMRGSNLDPKSNYHYQDLHNINGSNERFCNIEQPLGTQKRPPSVVAKLMGLEALPDSMSTSCSHLGLVKSTMVEHGDSFIRSLKTNDLNRSNRIHKSPRSSSKESASPRWKNPDLIKKPISKLPIEPAPWKQLDGNRGSQKPGFKYAKVPAKAPGPFPSVYSEIEKRLKDLEFKQSGKDLRALKQILEAMQTKGLLETSKEKEDSNFVSQRDPGPKFTDASQKRRLLSQQNGQSNQINGSRSRNVHSQRTYESPIVIMKPAKLVDRSVIAATSEIPIAGLPSLHRVPIGGYTNSRKGSINSRKAKDHSPRNSYEDSGINSSDTKTNFRNSKSSQSSTRPQQIAKESTTSSVRSSGSVSPRLQQKKLELEKRSRPPTPPSDSNKPRRPSNRHPTESTSPGGRRRLKSSKLPQSDDQLSQISNESRTSSHQGDDISVQSDSSVFDLKTDTEVTSKGQTNETNGSQCPSIEPFLISGSIQKKSSHKFEEEGALAEIAVVAPEHPSPVSVLDASLYTDDSLSPVKAIPTVPKGGGEQDSMNRQSDHHWNTTDNLLSNGVGSGLTLEINRRKLQNVENLVQKLRRLNSTHDEASTDYIASLCQNTNPDHRYISEILLASGLLLRDLTSGLTTFQLHPSGHPINPELFFVLEQTKASTTPPKEECNPGKSSHSKPNPEKSHRKLIFDAVNEILIKRLDFAVPNTEPWIKSDKVAKKTLSAQKLLKELCSEIEQLQFKNNVRSLEEEEDDLKHILCNDVMHRSERWTDFHGEISGVVLDVERLIFKDLVNEIVMGEGADSHTKPGTRRQLFAV